MAEDEDFSANGYGAAEDERLGFIHHEVGRPLGDVTYGAVPSATHGGPAPGPAEAEEEAPPPTLEVYKLSAIACLNSCNLGFDQGAVGGASTIMKETLSWNLWQQSIFVGSLAFVSIVGALGAGVIMDKIGRKRTFTLSSLIFVTGTLVTISTDMFGVILFGRMFTGFGIGLGLAIDPLYISEVAPAAHRGRLVTLSEIAINVGILLGFVSNFCFFHYPDGINWRLILGVGIVIPTTLIVLSLTIMLESPRWLMNKKREVEAAHVLQKVNPPGTDVGMEMAQMKDSIARESRYRSKGWAQIRKPTRAVRMALLAGVGIAIAQQITGQEAFIYFTPEILEDAGFKDRRSSFGMTVLIGVVKVLAIGVATLKADSFGRRPLMFASMAGIMVFLVVLGCVVPMKNMGAVSVFAMCGYVLSFSFGLGPITWLGASECFPMSIRAKAMSLATSLNRLTAGLVSFTALPLFHTVGPTGFFILYACCTFGAASYLYEHFPETKGRSLEEVTKDFEAMAHKELEQEAAAGERRARRASNAGAHRTGGTPGPSPSKAPASAPGSAPVVSALHAEAEASALRAEATGQVDPMPLGASDTHGDGPLLREGLV